MNKQILKLAIPNIISNLTVPLVGIVDVALMGRQTDSAFLGAIALGSTIFTFIYASFNFLRMGTSGFTAQSRGERNIQKSYLLLARALLIAVVIGLVLIFAQKIIAWLSFSFINSSDNVESLARQYFSVRIWAAPASLSLFAIMGWFIGMQNAKIPMWLSIIINVSNVLFSYVFVAYFNMQVVGVALGTLISQYIGLIVGIAILVKFHKKRIKRYWNRQQIFIRSEIAKFMNVNKDILVRSLLLTGSFYFFNASSASLGNDLLAVNSILLQFLWIFAYFIDGFAFAAEALVGKFIGAKDKVKLHKVVVKLFTWGIGLSLSVSLIYFIFYTPIIRVLTDQTHIINLSMNYRWWIIVLPVISFSAFVWDGVYIGATEGKTMRNAMIISAIIFFVPCMFLFKNFFGNNGMWLSLLIFMAIRGITLHIYYRKMILNSI